MKYDILILGHALLIFFNSGNNYKFFLRWKQNYLDIYSFPKLHQTSATLIFLPNGPCYCTVTTKLL